MCMPWNHKFEKPDFENCIQTCIKCGKVIRIAPKALPPVPDCPHVWGIIKNERFQHYKDGWHVNDYNRYTLQCTKCGCLISENH